MGNLRSFAREKKLTSEEKNELEKSLKERMKEYEGKSEDELTIELKKSVEQGKADGTFTPEALEAFASRVTPMLNGEQRQKLNDLMKMLVD